MNPLSHAARTKRKTQSGRPHGGRERSQEAATRYAILSNTHTELRMNIVKIGMTFAVALVMVLTATGLWATAAQEAPAAAVEKEMVLDPSTGKMVTAPEYGGTITGVLKLDWTWQFDTYTAGIAHIPVGGVVEKLGKLNWAMPRDEYHFQGGYMMPIHVIKGSLPR